MLSVAGHGGVPATGVTAVAVNVTAVNSGEWGYLDGVALRLVPTDDGPARSNVNRVVGNAAMPKLAADGTISIDAPGGPVEPVIVDVSGYYTTVPPTVSYAYNGDGLRSSRTTGANEGHDLGRGRHRPRAVVRRRPRRLALPTERRRTAAIDMAR